MFGVQKKNESNKNDSSWYLSPSEETVRKGLSLSMVRSENTNRTKGVDQNAGLISHIIAVKARNDKNYPP